MEVLSWQGSHGPGSSADLADPAFNDMGGPDLLSLGEILGEAGEQVVEIVAQGGDSLGVGGRRRAPLAGCLAFMTAWRPALMASWSALRTFVEGGPDCVRPAPLNGDAVTDDRQGGDEALAAVNADHLEALAGRPRQLAAPGRWEPLTAPISTTDNGAAEVNRTHARRSN